MKIFLDSRLMSLSKRKIFSQGKQYLTMNRTNKIIAMVLATTVFLYVSITLLRGNPEARMRSDPRGAMEFSHTCIEEKIRDMDAAALWDNVLDAVNICSTKQFLQLGGYQNIDEKKYHITPKLNDSCTIISLGIGFDHYAEEKLKVALPHCQFYGADPEDKVNKEIYERIGKYYQKAVGGVNGDSDALILNVNQEKYRESKVKMVDLPTFIKEDVQQTVLDNVWIDIEKSEYALFPLLLRGGKMDKEGITMCQYNIEVHAPDARQKHEFHSYFNQMIRDKQFVPMVASTLSGMHRFYLVNFDDPVCIDRYLYSLS